MKYKLTNNRKQIGNTTLYQIEALKDFNDVRKGDLGGYIEKEVNLSQYNNCWVYDNACVFDNAIVYGNAMVYDNARVYGNARVFDNAWVYDNAWVFGNAGVYEEANVYDNARVYGNAWVYDNACVFGHAIVYGNDGVTGETSTLTNVCKFNITYSVKDKYIRIGCKSHSFDWWDNYVNTGSTEYLKDCRNEREHQKCINCIILILMNKGV